MKILIVIISFLISAVVIGQTGPGGVRDLLDNSVWLDASKLNLLNGGDVFSWIDQSGNSNDFVQSNSTLRPKYVTNAINGFSAVEFDGVDDQIDSYSIPDLESASLTYFVVFDRTPLDNECVITGFYSNAIKWRTYSLSSTNKLISCHFSPTIKHENYIDPGVYTFLTVRIFPTYFEIYQNGQLMATKTATYTQPSLHNYIRLGGYASIVPNFTRNLDGQIAETIIYKDAINDLELDLIHNYLGAKYDIAPANDLYAYEATHNYEVIGIGNDGTDIHDNSTGSGVLNFSNPTGMGSGDYMIVGHNGEGLSGLDSVDISASLSTYSRLKRVWRIDETGTIGNIDVVYDLSGYNDFASSSSYLLLQDVDGVFDNAIEVSGVYDGVAETMTFNLDLADGDYITMAGEPVFLNIQSVQSGDWSDPASWNCGCVPDFADSAVILSSHILDLDINASIYKLSIDAGGQLNVHTNSVIDIYGDLLIVGDIDMTDGALYFLGNTNQTVDGGSGTIDFEGLKIETTSGAQVTFLNGTFVLNDVLLPVSGAMIVDPTASFIINSTSINTSARVGVMYPGFSLVGDVTVRRFIPGGLAGNRNLASPVFGATLNDWDADLAMSGLNFPDGCAYGGWLDTAGCYNSVKMNKSNIYIDITDINHTLVQGDGYEVYMGDNLMTFSGTTLNTKGALSTGAFTTPLFNNGWNLQGNPFASPVDFTAVVKSASVGNYYYIFDAASGGYQWYDGTSNTSSSPDLANGIIAIGQGFWTENWGFLSYPQLAKTSTSATFVRSNEVENAFYLTLRQDNSTYYSKAGVAFNYISTDIYDSIDVKRFDKGVELASSLYMSFEDDIKVQKNYLAKNIQDKSIDFTIECLTESMYTIESSLISNLADYKFAYLLDKETNELIDLVKEPNYSFYSEVGVSERFTLILSNTRMDVKESVIPNENTIDVLNSNIALKQYGYSIEIESNVSFVKSGELSVTNLIGQNVFTKTIDMSIAGSKFVNIPQELKGVFIISIITEYGITSKKIVLQ